MTALTNLHCRSLTSSIVWKCAKQSTHKCTLHVAQRRICARTRVLLIIANDFHMDDVKVVAEYAFFKTRSTYTVTCNVLLAPYGTTGEVMRTTPSTYSMIVLFVNYVAPLRHSLRMRERTRAKQLF